MRPLIIIALVSGFVISNGTAEPQGGLPAVTLNTPAAGATNLSGHAYNIDPSKIKVVIYALTNEWYVQPYVVAPFTNIAPDGSWAAFTNPWTSIVVLLVDPANYTPAPTEITNPALDPGVLAWTEYPAGPVSVNFSGRTWGIKATGAAPSDYFDPGPNFWSNDPSVVHVAADGLHLKNTQINGIWQCGEVYLLDSLGYGTYTVQVSSHLDHLDQNTVAAPLFIYVASGQELDNEYSGVGGLVLSPYNAQFVVQPYQVSGNIVYYLQPSTAQFSSQMEWAADHVTFRAWNGWSSVPATTDIIYEWTYTGSYIPPVGQDRVHINTWLFHGSAPVSGVGDEMVIGAFSFQPTITAAITSPAPGSTLSSSTATFQWTTGLGVQQYVLWVGSTGTGSGNLYVSTPATSTSVTVAGLPTDGSTLYVRLWSLTGAGWQSNDYKYTASTASAGMLAVMSNPPNQSALASSSQTFQWTSGTGVSQYVIWVGSTGVGSQDIHVTPPGTSTSATVSGLPTDGRTLYVRLWSLISAGWQSNDYIYYAVNLATMLSPAYNATLTSSSQLFQWTTGGTNVSQYVIWIGSTGAGSKDIYVMPPGTSTSATVSSLPTNGETLYVRLWSLVSAGWQSNDYIYSAVNLAAMTSPANNATLTSSSQLFQWTSGTGVSQYVIWVGSTGAGSKDIYVMPPGTSTSATVSGLPTNGETLYVRLWSLVSAGWQSNDYTYMAF